MTANGRLHLITAGVLAAVATVALATAATATVPLGSNDAAAQESPPVTTPGQLTVTGSATVDVTPDIALFSLTATALEPTATTAATVAGRRTERRPDGPACAGHPGRCSAHHRHLALTRV